MNRKIGVLFLIIFLGSLLFIPLISLAGTYQADGRTVTYEGLVPCGKTVTVDSGSQYISCQFCHFFVMFDAILDFVFFQLVPPVAVLMLVIGGAMFFFAGGSPQTIGQAKKIMTSVVMGLVIVYGAWLIINLFFSVIGVADWTGLREGWFQINCSISL